MDTGSEGDAFEELVERLRVLRGQHALQGGQRFRVPKELLPALCAAVAERQRQGQSLSQLSRRLKVSPARLLRWKQAPAPAALPKASSVQTGEVESAIQTPKGPLRPVRVCRAVGSPPGGRSLSESATLTLYSPGGYRLCGLTLWQAAALLRRLG